MRVLRVAVYEGEMSKARERREVREGARRRKKAYGGDPSKAEENKKAEENSLRKMKRKVAQKNRGERRKRKKTVRNGSAVVEFRSSLLAILCC